MLDKKTLRRITNRGVNKIIEEKEFIRLLQEGKPLRLKMGFDPSRPDIHLGHVVGLRKLRELQELGHKVILIVGDWTAQIGDPSGQSVMRPMLSHAEVISNAETYMRQLFRVVDKDRTEAIWQSEWFGKFDLSDVIRLTSRFTVAQFLDREDFSNRFKGGKPIAITELLYPLLQAYDSVAIHSDVEFGGSDQEFNLLVGRDLQGMMGQRPQQCFLMPLLVGLDGVQKMSKSLNNYVGVEDNPEEMYGKLMSIPDSLIINYFELLTDMEDEDLSDMRNTLETNAENPMEMKKRLALDISSQFWGPERARKGQENFERIFQEKGVPKDAQPIRYQFFEKPTGVWIRFKFSEQRTPSWVEMRARKYDASSMSFEVPLEDLLQSVLQAEISRSEIKRLIDQNVGIVIDGEKHTCYSTTELTIEEHKKTGGHKETVQSIVSIRNGSIIRIGNRRFFKFIPSEPSV